MRCTNADFHGINSYPGWYGGGSDFWNFAKTGYVTEAGAGGVTTTHCDYKAAVARVDRYEPEEYQQLIAEARFQQCLRENDGSLGMFTWWTMRDFTDTKYKKPIGWNTKGLLPMRRQKGHLFSVPLFSPPRRADSPYHFPALFHPRRRGGQRPQSLPAARPN